jgi:hypothetical protein
MSLRSGGRQLSFELLAGDLTADDPDDISPRSLPDTSSDGQRRRRRRSKRKRGFRSPPIQEAVSEGEQQPRVEGGGNSAAAFRVLDLKSTAETVCESSDAERSAASCVTYVGVELRQRSVSGGGRVVAASADDGTSSCGSSTRESAAAAAAVADVAAMAWRPEANGGMKKKLEKESSLDWEKYMKDNNKILGGSDLTVHCNSAEPHAFYCDNLMVLSPLLVLENP